MTGSTYTTEAHGAEVAHSMCVLYANGANSPIDWLILACNSMPWNPSVPLPQVARHDGANEHKSCGACAWAGSSARLPSRRADRNAAYKEALRESAPEAGTFIYSR
jgi:hypothetical protein